MKHNTMIVKISIFLRKKIHLLFAILLIVNLNSCDKFVTVENPPDILTFDKVFADDKSSTSAILSVYTDMMNDQYGSNGSFVCFTMSSLGGMSANELIWTQSNTSALTYQEFTDHALTPSNSYVKAFWKDGYKYIYRINAILNGLQVSTGMTSQGKKQIEGEAKFIRAFCYFYLVNLFGDVPLVLSTDYKSNMILPRTATNIIWEQIINDLKQAKALLTDNYITTERLRPNKATVSALLARAYLYTGKWLEAETEADAVISSGTYGSSLPPLDKVFKKDSPETIWQLQPVRANLNTIEGASFFITGTSRPSYEITAQLLSAFEPSDKRKKNWIGFSNAAYPSWAFPAKYKAGTVATVTEYYIVFRLTEQYLIRAEARARQGGGKITLAINDLNVVRSRAGLEAINPTDQAKLFLAIENERQVEFFTEWGHRWLDLKRTNRAEVVLKPLSPNGSWNKGSQLYPIPDSELNSNPNLTQNEGY